MAADKPCPQLEPSLPVTIKPHFQTLILESLVACCEPFPECTYSVQMALFTLFIIKDMQLMQRDKYINS